MIQILKLVLCCVAALGTLPALAAAGDLGRLTLLPRSVKPGVPTTVVATIRIAAPDVIPGSVIIAKADSAGRPATRLGSFRQEGDVWIAEMTINEPAESAFPVVASAAFKGVLLRSVSSIALIEVDAAADTVSPRAILGDSVLEFKDSSRRTIFNIPISTQVQPQLDGSVLRAEYVPIISSGQTAAAVMRIQKHIAPFRMLDENTPTSEAVDIYSGAKGKTATIAAPSGRGFYLPVRAESLLSASGDRIALATEPDVGGGNVQILAYDAAGRILFEHMERFANIQALAISRDGAYLGAIVTRIVDARSTFVFTVAALPTGEVFEREFDLPAGTGYVMRPSTRGFELILGAGQTITLP